MGAWVVVQVQGYNDSVKVIILDLPFWNILKLYTADQSFGKTYYDFVSIYRDFLKGLQHEDKYVSLWFTTPLPKKDLHNLWKYAMASFFGLSDILVTLDFVYLLEW